jgi:hypothetical protein
MILKTLANETKNCATEEEETGCVGLSRGWTFQSN